MSQPTPWHFDPITGQYLEPTRSLVISPFRNKWFELIRRDGHLVEHGPAPLKECKDMAALILERERGSSVNGCDHAPENERRVLRGGIGSDNLVVERKPKRTPKHAMESLVGLVLRHGTNVSNWTNYRECLAEVDLKPDDVGPGMLVRAAEHAAQRISKRIDEHKDRQKMRPLAEVKAGRGFRVPHDFFEERFRGWGGVKVETLENGNNCVTLFKDQILEVHTWSERTEVIYEPELRLPDPAPPDDPTQVAEETEMRLVESGARSLLKTMGLVIADDPEALPVDKLKEKINDLPKFLEYGGKEPATDSEDRELFEACMKAIENKKTIRIGDRAADETDNDRQNPDGGKKKAKKEKAPKAERNGRAPRQVTSLKPGDTITRHYQKKDYEVTVAEDGGFQCGGKSYSSLTALAKKITGYDSINGRAFFKVKV